MKYDRIKDPVIAGLPGEFLELSPHDCADTIRRLATKLKHDVARERHICEFEDGRRNWMVTYSKYNRLKEQNLQLKKENESLKAAILKLSVMAQD